MLGLVAQTIQITIQIGVKWIAQTPPKRQVEGSNPSEPAPISVLFSGFHKYDGEIENVGRKLKNNTV
jgi:hypothetical protein